jgi:hypothetical protein
MESFQSFVGRDLRRLLLRSRSGIFLAGLICLWLVAGSARTKAAEPASTLVLDPAIEQKIDSLLQQMTVEEKVGQLNQFNGDYVRTGPVPQDPYHQAKYSKLKSGEVGSFLNAVGARQTRTVQQMAIEGSRFKIPLLFGLDVIHGFKTIFEVAQLYIRDWVASVVRPVKQLKGFRKLELKAGETREVAFTLTSDDLKFYDGEMKYTGEPGEFSVFVGGNSRDVLEKQFVLEGQ